MSKSSKERQAELKARREAEGKVKRPYWATVPEHEQVKLLLSDLRDENTRTKEIIKMTIQKGYESNDSASFNENDAATFDEQHVPQEYTPKDER